MEFNIMSQFSFDFKSILLDEIALEGLEGIDIDLLWRRVEKTISMPLTEKMKKRYWDFIVSSPSVSLYELPEPVPYLEIKDRFTIIDEDSGRLKDPDDYLDGPYEHKLVENEYGSCVQYHKRKLIKNISSLSYEEVIRIYNQKLVMVASIDERCKALAPHVPKSVVTGLSPIHYCLLELIGRSRENGQMTIGKTNILKIFKDSKMLFYLRKVLKELDMIRITCITQKIGHRGVKSLLLRLRRFHKSETMSLPKIGPIHDVVELLKTQENFTESLDNVYQKGFFSKCPHKKINKTYNVFHFTEKEEQVEGRYKKKIAVKRRYISISTKSDSSSGSEDEASAQPLKCQYKVGISLLRQAYMRIHEAGLRGLTQVELSQLLGTEFYTTRNLCKMLRTQGLLKEVYEDKGRQRIARLVVNCNTNYINVGYEEEWQKFLNNRIKYKDCIKKEEFDTEKPTSSSDNFEGLHNNYSTDDVNWSDVITEIKKVEHLESFDLDNVSLLSSKKTLTLRQLKFANGIIKVLEEKFAIAGYQALNNIVSAEIGEPHMDTRALKVFVQKLITDGLVKVYKIKWPNQCKYTNFICSSSITINHPILKDKYREILEKIHITKESQKTREVSKGKGNRSLCHYAIPRYCKVRKFHEFIFKMAYSHNWSLDSRLPEGFAYLRDVIQEMTVEFSLGNVNLFGNIKLTSTQVADTLNMKLKDVPEGISREIVYAGTFRNTLKENLRILAFFGLVQIVNQPLEQNFDNIMFYVNRHPKIVNTTGAWPRPNADIKELESECYLANNETVREFWNTVFKISCNTTIMLGKRKNSNLKPPVRMMAEVEQYDNGTRLGDGKGACGFDSSFYLELAKLWRTTVLEQLKSIAKPTWKPPPKIPKLIQKKKMPKPKVKSKKVLAREIFRERMLELNKLKIPLSRGKSRLVSESWSKVEDLIIILCKLALTIMGPMSLPGSFRFRNIVAREIISVNDPGKTLKSCHRRALYLDSRNTWAYEKQHLLNEFKKRQTLYKKYEGLLRKIKARISCISKFMSEAKMPMIELIWILLQITKSESFVKRSPCIATSYNNFHEKFSICEVPDNTPYELYNMPGASDHETLLKESIMLTVAMSYNKEVPVNIAKKIYILFKEYPEMSLRKSIEELRKSQAISAREKLCNNKIYKMNLQDLVECSYKLSAGYYRKWISKLNAEFMELVADAFNMELPAEDIKGDSGINCFCCELQNIGLIELSTYVAPSLVGSSDFSPEESFNVINIENNSKLRSGTNAIKSTTNAKKISLFVDNFESNVNTIARNANVTYPKHNMEKHKNDNIVCFLKDKQQKGSTFAELQEFSKSDSEALIQKLQDLEAKRIIKRVGFYDNRIVHIEYAKFWAMTLDGETFLPAPWITLYGTLRHEIFFKWTNVVISKIFENPGCSITYITEMCELISAKSIQDICHFLFQCDCVKMKVIKYQKVDLFSDDDAVEELSDYNPYEAPSNILVFTNSTSLTRYASVRRQLLRPKEES
ncbi:uncharacterized protein LOC128677667 [Plodia interpunctella]|uniref:uncharacterized protein LOC128677667 n=1 Tax=Plodia interpunctella TaxID=58824 RepID=UPI002367A01B|nr:uncharacterized protein LOC128677667 [Plodia interpunctella]